MRALNQAKQALKNKQDQLNQLEDELDGPQQELEEKKLEEAHRKKNIAVMEKEIEVCACGRRVRGGEVGWGTGGGSLGGGVVTALFPCSSRSLHVNWSSWSKRSPSKPRWLRSTGG